MALFRTLDVPTTQPCLYQISIRAPDQGYADIATYTFPLTPTSIQLIRSSLSNAYETQGSPINQGVSRVIDTYGLTPPTFLIEGTTGWDYHSADGYTLTGLQSILTLSNFLARYAELNQVQRAAGDPNLYALEFYDYFTQNFWQIEPVGPQLIRQTAERPLLVYYRFRWAAIQQVAAPLLGIQDILFASFQVPAAQAALVASVSIGNILNAYGPGGP